VRELIVKRAADVKFSDMEAGDTAKFIQIANKYGGEVVT